jgi:hypothetical protein
MVASKRWQGIGCHIMPTLAARPAVAWLTAAPRRQDDLVVQHRVRSAVQRPTARPPAATAALGRGVKRRQEALMVDDPLKPLRDLTDARSAADLRDAVRRDRIANVMRGRRPQRTGSRLTVSFCRLRRTIRLP